MKRYIAENIEKVQDLSKLEKMVEMIVSEQKEKQGTTAEEIWAEIKSKHDGLMKRLAQ